MLVVGRGSGIARAVALSASEARAHNTSWAPPEPGSSSPTASAAELAQSIASDGSTPPLGAWGERTSYPTAVAASRSSAASLPDPEITTTPSPPATCASIGPGSSER